MEKFYFEKPSLERKDEIIEYLDEFVKYGSDINGSGGLDRIYYGYTFKEALDRCLKMEDEEYAKSIDRCPGKTFLLIREDDDKIVGTINLRWALTDSVLKHGHIGYGIRPTERRKGYNKINLYMVLKEAKEIGLDRVMLTCYVENLGSNSTIKALGGVLEKCEKEDDKLLNIYWIDVDEAIEKYKDVYGPYILNNKVR